jgi:hypothetical protein
MEKNIRKKYEKLSKKYFSKKYHCLDFGDDDESSERARKCWAIL